MATVKYAGEEVAGLVVAAYMVAGSGPMKVMPASMHRCANCSGECNLKCEDEFYDVQQDFRRGTRNQDG
jgi:hypothetical protein